jgi:uncharacterized protein
VGDLVEELLARILLVLLTGLLAGLLSGLFGIGGGILMVPVLHYILRLEFPLATSISLLVIALNTPYGLLRQHRHSNVLWREGSLLVAGGAAGVIVAMLLRPHIPIPVFKGLFAVVAGLAAYRLVRPLHPPVKRIHPLWLPVAGFAGGLAAHWLGIGGGLVMVPVLLFLGTAIHLAVATSLLPVFTNAAVSTLFDLPLISHHLALAIPLAVGAVVGIRGGVGLANRLPALRLQRAFAAVLTLLAVYMLIDALG